jgi:hypothetical protein
MIISIDSDVGRIGPFWWANRVHSKMELHNATYNGSVHYVWRPGFCGLDPWFVPKTFKWIVIK